MFTHICVGSNDLETSKKFYDAVMSPLGVKGTDIMHDRVCIYATETGSFLVLKPADGNAATHANGGTIGFMAADAAAVDAFHAAGLENGGSDEGAPGKRPNAPGNAYGAYLRDPFGNKICAYCQLPEDE